MSNKTYDLKHEILVIAGRLTPGEAMPLFDSQLSFRHLVQEVVGSQSTTLVQTALIATVLAGAIDEVLP
jgi:hypothetical protein